MDEWKDVENSEGTKKATFEIISCERMCIEYPLDVIDTYLPTRKQF